MKKLLSSLIIFVAVISQSSCATHSVTERTETVSSNAGDRQESRTTVTEKTTHESEPADPYCNGLLSCTVTLAGDIIAAPFRLVGGIIDVIF